MDENQNISSRAFVVEMSVKIEHSLNLIITQLLGVKPEETLSFGNSTQALSFNAKANLLLDLKYLDKNNRQKFQIFMEIRNKFAHLYSIDTFGKCFAQTKNYNQLKKLFDIDNDGDSIEEDMEIMFSTLSMDIAMTLKKIDEKIRSEMVVKYSQRRFTEAVKTKREDYNSKNPENAAAVGHFIEYIITDLQFEVDEKIKNKIPPHI